MQAHSPEPLLTSKSNGRRMLGGIGATKFDELIASGQLESVKIGSRRLIVIDSLRRLAGVEPDQQEESK